jgi:hypothetical protein
MSTSFTRRNKRQQDRLRKKINEQFLKRIEGKSNEEIAVIMEQIRVKYNLEKPEEEPQVLNPIDINVQ